MSNNSEQGQRLERIRKSIAEYPDFPKPGIIFRDVFPLFYQPELLEDVFILLEEHIGKSPKKVDAIVGLESRGFLIGPTLSLRLKVPFVPVRKAGKLPGKCKSVAYELEYGKDVFEIQEASIKKDMNCVIVDDLLATGGSIKTAVDLIQQCGGQVCEAVVIIELVDLKGQSTANTNIFSLIKY